MQRRPHAPTPFMCIRTLLAIALFATIGGSAMAQLSAARVMSVTGTAKAIDAQGVERVLEKGGEVRSGDKVVTADGALVQLKLNDGGFMSVRSGTEMVIDRFVYDEKTPANSNFLVSLVRGGFRSITGLIGRTNPNAYQIRTGTATVGIRGTDHEPMVIPEGIPAMAAMGAPGLYDKVNEGETFIRNGLGELALKRGQIGFTPTRTDRPPLMLQKIPEFYRVDVKVDGRESKDVGDGKREGPERVGSKDGLLRPSAAARGAALKGTAGVNELETRQLSGEKVLSPTTDSVIAPAKTLIAPSTTLTEPKTTMMLAPTDTLVAPSTTITEPKTTLIAPTTTLIAPTTTQIAPMTTQIAPTTTLIAPTTTYIAPTTTLIAPTTTYIAPTTTYIAPTTTLTAPKTTYIAPMTTTTIIK